MKVLIVCSKNSGRIAPFITDQVEALQEAGANCEYFTVEGKGIKGYLLNLLPLWRKIKVCRPDIIHAHYGLSGVLANLQRKVPVVTTYHGSDINNAKVRRFSKIAIRLSAWNIFVSQKNIQLSGVKKRFSLIPCGVDTNVFKPMDKAVCRQKFGFEPHEKLILFAGAFDNKVKNPELAIAAVAKIPDARLLELKGYNRTQVAELMNAVDVCLMTSHTEGSPQFVKEALACNCPVVSVNVGDVEELLQGVEHCRIVEREVDKIAKSVSELLNLNQRSPGSEKIRYSGYESLYVVDKIKNLYQNIIENA
ncbi:MAG: glycosyltransferase [Paludibacter sp.]|nr:glycosyltransferase [Paludibacter sp.]